MLGTNNPAGTSRTQVNTVAVSGAAQTLSFAAQGDVEYDITLSQACAISIAQPSSNTGLQKLTLTIRPAGFQASLPPSSANLVWAGGQPPVPSQSADTIIVFLFDGTAPVFGNIP